MGHVWDATYTVKSIDGLVTTGVIRNIPAASTPTQAKLLAFVTDVKGLINGGVQEHNLLDWNEDVIAGTVTPEGLNSDKAMISYQYMDADDITKFERMYLPNPDVATHFEAVGGEGYRMTAAARTTFAGLLSTATGLTITVSEGKLVSQAGYHGRRDHHVLYEDETGNLCPMHVLLATNAGTLSAFATAAQGFSLSKTVKATFLTRTRTINDPAAGIGLAETDALKIDFSSVEAQMKARFFYADGEKRKYMTVLLPSIARSACYQTAKKKNAWKLLNTIADPLGNDLATSLNTLLGATKIVAYKGSKFDGINLKTQ